MRILISEDDFTSRAILTAVLRKWGYDPVTTENGAQAWEVLQQPGAPKLVLLDWNMPEMDGVEVVRRVRKLVTSEPPYIIVVTSDGAKASIVAGLEAGANDYVVKPYDTDELLARIRVGQRMVELQAKLLEARNALAHEAMHDHLTGAANRRAIMAALSGELARTKRQNTGLSIGICDIDHFKRVNDAHGHQVGDEVLCGVVRLLEGSLRKYDRVGRWGGEEFLVVAPGSQEDEAGRLYERLRATLADNPIPTQAGKLSITVSIWAATWKADESAEELLGAADAALYRAKDTGRNRVCVAAAGELPANATSEELVPLGVSHPGE